MAEGHSIRYGQNFGGIYFSNSIVLGRSLQVCENRTTLNDLAFLLSKGKLLKAFRELGAWDWPEGLLKIGGAQVVIVMTPQPCDQSR